MDLVRIYRVIAYKGFPMNAAAFVGALTDFCFTLCSFPERGVSRNDLAPGLRVLGYREQATIAFHVDDKQKLVTILRILGRGQSLEKAFATE